jgi:hypothetical protein
MLSVTERAEAAIGYDDDAADWQLRPEEHGKALPREAANLRRVLERPELQQLVAEFHEADGAAVATQRRYKRIGRTSLYAATIATLVGSLFLLPLDPSWPVGRGALPPSCKLAAWSLPSLQHGSLPLPDRSMRG